MNDYKEKFYKVTESKFGSVTMFYFTIFTKTRDEENILERSPKLYNDWTACCWGAVERLIEIMRKEQNGHSSSEMGANSNPAL